MSNLFLVRHGQASFLEENYDKLSAKGEQQSRMLGQYWAARGVVFDEVYSGPRARQVGTARLVGEAYGENQLRWPQPVILENFDEFRAEEVVERALPGLLASDGSIRSLYEDFRQAEGQAARFKSFQRVFEIVIARWAGGSLAVEEVESWPEFCTRVEHALEGITRQPGNSRNIVIFSSGGPTGVAMQRALQLSTPATLRTAWMVANSAFSHFIFSGDRFTLASYNAYPHITERELFTYR